MRRLRILLCFVVLLPLGIRAQDDHDIAASLNLKEVVILADGQTFEEYLVKQVLDHAKPLKKRVHTLRYSVTCKMEKDMDLTQIPHRRTVTFAARLAGYGQIVKALMEHKVFGITAAEDILASTSVRTQALQNSQIDGNNHIGIGALYLIIQS